MPESLRGFYSKAEAQGAVFQVMYVYPAAEYDRIKAGVTSALRREFKSVEAKEYDSKQYDLETDTILFEKKTQRRKRCVGIIHRRSEHIKFTTVAIKCNVMSYWTKWNKPPTHAPFEFIAWRNDWYMDFQATLVESIKLQEAVRQDLGYEFPEVGRIVVI